MSSRLAYRTAIRLHRLAGILAAFLACGPSARPGGGGASGEATGPKGSSSGASETSSGSGVDVCPELIHVGDLAITPETVDLASAYGITEIRGDLTIARLDSLDDLAPLECLRHVDGTVKIGLNRNLRTLDGLSHLEGAAGIYIGDNRLQSLAGLASLRETATLEVLEGELTSLDLPSLERVGGLYLGFCYGGGDPSAPWYHELTMYGNPMLQDLGDLGALQAVDDLRLEGNGALESLDSLRALAENGGTVRSVSILHNASLPTDHIHEILDVLGAEGTVCGNLGDEEQEQCACRPPGE